MSLRTPNYNLFKPELTDPADITKMNPNWDTLDSKLHEIEDNLANFDGGNATLLVKTAIIRANGWSEDEETGAKYQTVIITDITSDMTAKIDTVNTHERTTDGYALYVEEQNQFLEFITNGDAETVNGGIKFYIYGEPNTVDIPIIVEVS